MWRRNNAASFFSHRRNVAMTAVFYTYLWGCAFPLVKICMESFSVAPHDQASKCLLAGIRFFCAGLLTLTVTSLFLKEKLSLDRKTLVYSLSYGTVATALQYAFTYIGLSMIDGSKGAVYDQLGVFVVVLASGLVFREERLNVTKVAGCVLGFLGVLAVNTEGGGFSFQPVGEGVMLLAILCQILAFFIAKRSADAVSALLLTGLGQLFGGALLLGGSLLFGGRIGFFSLRGFLCLLALTVISSVAYALSLMPLKYYPVSEISSYNLLITVFGVVMSAALLGEQVLRWNYALSLGLISFGILLISFRGKEKTS